MRRLRFGLATAVVLTATVLALSGRWPWRRLETRAPVVLSVPVPAPVQEIRDTLRGGETLGDLFERQGLVASELVHLFENAGLDLRRLRAGLVIQFRRQAGEETPSHVSLRSGPKERLAVTRVANAWSAERQSVVWRTEVVRFEGPIGRSLYDALDASIPNDVLDGDNRVRLAWDLADVYAWSIDFNRDIQPGDRFAVLMEREISEEGEVRSGGILGADLLVSGKHLHAYRFEGGDGSSRYYDADGNSLRRAFLRVPVEFRRISSSFSRARFHPILGIWRRHEGTDYAAASGTPVMAAGDGTVLRAGRSGGYGNLIEIRHRNGITTRYGHLRAFARGVHAGNRVEQGDVIGYVGATGLASGAHLHYEFRVNGVARDSRRVDLGGGEPLSSALLPLFQRSRSKLASALGEAGQMSVAAKAE